MIVVPVSVRAYKVKVSVVNDTVSVVIVPSAITATLVSNMITAALTKENIPGLKSTDSPEFADTQITPLALESTYTPTVWNYLVELFTDVPKSVLQHIVKGWTVMQNLAARISVLENKTLFEITLEKDVIQIDIVGLSIKEGETFNFLIAAGAGYEAGSIRLLVNDISSNNYHYAAATIYNYNVIVTGNDRYCSSLTMTLHDGNLIGGITYARSHLGTLAGGFMQESTFDLSIQEINKISIIRNGTAIIKAGTKIKLIKG